VTRNLFLSGRSSKENLDPKDKRGYLSF